MDAVADLRAEFGKAIAEVKAQIADSQRTESIDFTILDALVAGDQDNADPAWLHATPANVDENGDPVDTTDPTFVDPDAVPEA